jgi:hypothetical protein
MRGEELALFSLPVVAAMWFVTGWMLGRKRERNWWHDEMIRRRHAVFHWENGKWYWNEDEPPTPRDPAATKVAQVDPKNLRQFGVDS